MSKIQHQLQWSDIAFSNKKSVNELNGLFIAAPREISQDRLVQLVKQYLPEGNIVLGLADEDYVLGFEKQPHFKTLQYSEVAPIAEKVWKSTSKNKIYTLNYSQRDADHIFDGLKFRKVVLVNGSWLYAFHSQKRYFILSQKGTPIEYVSPFYSEQEAKDFASKNQEHLTTALPSKQQSTLEMLQLANEAAKSSYDYMFQAALALGVKNGDKDEYKPLLTCHNKVVPYETYAMHHGSAREANFSPPNDLNHYDTVHAESLLPLEALNKNIDLKNTTIFINLLPCPTCSRMIAASDISEVVYQIDHSNGYAIKMLKTAGKTVRRVVV